MTKDEQIADLQQKAEWAWQNAREYAIERDMIACALARCYPSHLAPHSRNRRGSDWNKTSLCIHTPEGQITFMCTPEMLSQLADLELSKESDYDGCKRPEKRQRLLRLGLKVDASKAKQNAVQRKLETAESRSPASGESHWT
jgi:hypothetical protein